MAKRNNPSLGETPLDGTRASDPFDNTAKSETAASEVEAPTIEVEAPTKKENVSSDGVGRLKYAGVGSPRGHEGSTKLTGAEITSLGSLEAEIMGLLWNIGRPASGMEVMEASLYKRRAQGQEPVSFATIATTLRRLSEKGILRSDKNQTRTPIYSPLVGREELAARILNNVSVTLLGWPLHGLLPKLLGNRGRNESAQYAENQEEVQRLLQALEDVADGLPLPKEP